jgi:hypothetical protein
MSEEQYLTNELYWEELVRQKDARIKWLEIEVQRRAGETIMANDRIEALEAQVRRYAAEAVLANTRVEALEDLIRNIAGLDDSNLYISSHAVLVRAVREWRDEARAALAPEQDK